MAGPIAIAGMIFKGGKWVSKIASKKLKSKVTPKKTKPKNNNPKGTNQWSKTTKSGKPPKKQTKFKGGTKDYERIKAQGAAKRKAAVKKGTAAQKNTTNLQNCWNEQNSGYPKG